METKFDTTGFEYRIRDKVRSMKEPSEEIIFDKNHRISVHHCLVDENECCYIEIKHGDDTVRRYEYGYLSIFDIAKYYLDNEAARTRDPLMLAYYTYCYSLIDLDFDEMIQVYHNTNEQVALIVLRDSETDGVEACYVTAQDKPDSILTFNDRQRALEWYKKSRPDKKVFTVPVNYIDKIKYRLTSYQTESAP